MRKDNKFRFSLQWGTDTQEQLAAGEFLEKLGNKKSDLVVAAVWEYLRQHPDVTTPGTQIKITTQPTFNKEQVLAEVKSAVKAYVEEFLSAIPPGAEAASQEIGPPALSEDDLNDMLENLNVFES